MKGSKPKLFDFTFVKFLNLLFIKSEVLDQTLAIQLHCKSVEWIQYGLTIRFTKG